MALNARYDGTCAVTGRHYLSGAKIEKTRMGWALADEQTHDTLAAIETAPINLRRGEGYGGEPYTVGELVRGRWYDTARNEPREGLVLVLVATAQYYAGEMAMSMGVGDDGGYLYIAWGREATAEEAAPLLAAETAAAERRREAARPGEIAATIARDGARPAADAPLVLAGERILDTQNLYGGGDWFVIDDNGDGPQGAPAIWHVRNNGADGDDWSRNNVRTGGAGAVGAYIPYDAALADELRALDAAASVAR